MVTSTPPAAGTGTRQIQLRRSSRSKVAVMVAEPIRARSLTWEAALVPLLSHAAARAGRLAACYKAGKEET